MNEISNQDVGGMAGLIGEYGAGIVAIAIIFLLFAGLCVGVFLLLKSHLKASETQIQIMLKKLLGSVEEPQEDVLAQEIQISEATHERLKYLVGITKCDRAAIYMFHNGVKFLNGSHVLKFSCLIEHALLNRYLCIQNHKDIPVNAIREVCNSLSTKGDFECWDVMHSSDDNEVVAWFKARKVQSVCLSAIYDERGRVMGFASCEFILRPALNTDEICEKIQMETKNLANGVAMAMDLGLLPREED